MEWTPDDIRGFKERHKLTAEEMAELLGINRSYVFLLLKGQKKPSEVLSRLLECLDDRLQREDRPERRETSGET